MTATTSTTPRENAKDRLIVGLDVPSLDTARDIVAELGDDILWYKIGYQLAFRGGLELASELVRNGRKVFLDLKFLDIDNTVAKGVEAVAEIGVSMLTIHAYPRAMRAAVDAARGHDLTLLAVTVLTSMDMSDMEEAGYAMPPADLVARRAHQARDSGMGGIVCAAPEARMVRTLVGPHMAIVTPGIRPAGSDAGDQKRVMTPGAAILAGASHLVVARPIVAAPDPRQAALAILDEMKAQ